MTPVQTVHASCVAWGARALLILGRSGTGKSTLALELMALRARLVADDRVALWREGGALRAGPAKGLEGMIEARGVGLLRAPWLASAAVTLALDLDAVETQRMPQPGARVLLGATIPLMLRPERMSAAVMLAALRYGPPLDPQAPVSTPDPD